MPAPVITSVVVSYPAGRNYLLPGESAQVDAEVYDPTGSVAEVSITVTDAEGHQSHGAASVVMNDEVVASAALRQMDYDIGWRVDQINAFRWAVTAPEDL